MQTLSVIALQEEHLPAVAEIFNHYVLNSTYSFEYEPVDLDRMKAKVGIGDVRCASYALMDTETLIGYGMLKPWKLLPGYRYTSEVSIYLHPEMISKGHGKLLLDNLEHAASVRGLRDVIAGVSSENAQSTRFFEKHGYQRVAFFPGIGSKFDRELDMLYLQKRLTPP